MRECHLWQIMTDRIDCCRAYHHIDIWHMWLKGEIMYGLDQRWNVHGISSPWRSPHVVNCCHVLRVEQCWTWLFDVVWRYRQPKHVQNHGVVPALCSDLAAPKERDGTDPVTEMETISHPGKVPEVTGAAVEGKTLAGWIWENHGK